VAAGAFPPQGAAAGARDGAGRQASSSLLYPGLFNVAATSSGNAWAVGEYQSGQVNRTLIVHWNGKTWRQVPSPNPSPAGDSLNGVAATSASHVWAVGTDTHTATWQNVIAHWNGKAWKLVPSPIGDGSLFGVTATSAANVWAVGAGGASATIEHWNGARWSGTTFG
jgi:hypothetical protein